MGSCAAAVSANRLRLISVSFVARVYHAHLPDYGGLLHRGCSVLGWLVLSGAPLVTASHQDTTSARSVLVQ